MFVSEESAGYFLDTFHGRQDECDVAILILSTQAAEVVGELIDKVSNMDIALGEEIGLFLFGSPGNIIEFKTGSTIHLVPGSKINRGYQSAKDFFENSSDTLFVPERIKQNIIARTSRIPLDFCNLLGIDPSKLPAVCILFRGWEDVVVSPVGDRMDFAALSYLARTLREDLDALSVRLEVERRDISQLDEMVKKLDAAQGRHEAHRIGAINSLKALERRYGFVVTPQIQVMFQMRSVAVGKVADLIREQRPHDWPAISASKSWKGAVRSIGAWTSSEENVRALSNGSLISNVISRREYLERFGDEIRKVATAALESSGLSIERHTTYRVPMSKIGAALDFASKAAQLLGKLTALKAIP